MDTVRVGTGFWLILTLGEVKSLATNLALES